MALWVGFGPRDSDSVVGSDTSTGLTTWDNISYEEAAKAMKAALEQGANFWNGVSKSRPSPPGDKSPEPTFMESHS